MDEKIDINGAIVVSLVDQISCSGNYNIPANFIDKVTARGEGYSSKFKKDDGISGWVLRLTSCDDNNDYYDQFEDKEQTKSKFRLATVSEIAEYKEKGPHILNLFKEGDLVRTETGAETTEHNYKVPAGYVNKIEGILYHSTDPNKSVLWFKGHPGGFKLKDFKKYNY